MAQFIRPESDISIGNWNGSFADIDETSANDSDFGWSDDNTDDVYETALGSNADPNGSGGHTVRCRISRTDGGVPNDNNGSATSVLIELIQGTTIIATVRADANVGLWEDVSYTLSGAEADAITDYSDLKIRFTFTGGGGGPSNRRGMALSWAEMELPDFAEPPTGVDMKINITELWKSVDAVKINIGDIWKEVIAIKINISGVWKDVL